MTDVPISMKPGFRPGISPRRRRSHRKTWGPDLVNRPLHNSESKAGRRPGPPLPAVPPTWRTHPCRLACRSLETPRVLPGRERCFPARDFTRDAAYGTPIVIFWCTDADRQPSPGDNTRTPIAESVPGRGRRSRGRRIVGIAKSRATSLWHPHPLASIPCTC